MRSPALELGYALALASVLGCGGAPPPAMSAPADTLPVLADGQVALVLLATNRGEVTTAGAAEPNLRLADIDDYARRAIADHTAATAREETLLADAGITPLPSWLSDELMQRTLVRTLTWVLQSPGRAYDLAYICTELNDDERVVQAFNRLVVTIESAPLRAETVRAREMIAQHIALAGDAISAQGGCLGGGP